MTQSLLQKSAVASGLITQAELGAMLKELRGDGASGDVSDDRLAEKLIASGKVNTWQVQQLKNGRKDFTLGTYHLFDSIGRGGMGEVYKAEHAIMGRIVAVKVLPRSRSTPDAISNFHREIRTLAGLDHPNLVRAFDAGHVKNTHFLVTEFVPGTDLRKLVRAGGPLTMQQAASIISQAALGLEHAHGRGLIHRDVKPANILVTPDGHAKVLDLGLAGYFNDPEQVDQYGGKVVGTADYLAPEAILRPDQLDKRSDLYSLGCTLYYAVTTKVPFPSGTPTKDTMREKARAHCQQAPLDPRRLNSELTDDFVEVIADMMAKRPEDRVSSAAQVVERLKPWVLATTVPPLIAEPVSTLPVPIRKPATSAVGDTEPFFLVQPLRDPAGESSVSQASMGTHAAAMQDETIPAVRSRPRHGVRRPLDSSAARARVMLLVAAIAVVVVLSALAMHMVYKMVAR